MLTMLEGTDPYLLATAVAGVVVVGCLFFLLFILVSARARKNRMPVRDPKQDHANTMILFQSMRDLLRAQKDLARQLNRSIDKKVGVIREAVGKAVEEQKQLREAQRELADLLQDTKKDLASMQTQITVLKEHTSGEAYIPKPAATVAIPETVDPAEVDEPLRALADTEGDPEKDVLDSWAGVDFGPQPVEKPYKVPDQPPEAPEDAEAAREAFRRLLDMGPKIEETPPPQPVASTAPRGGNGRPKITPLQARVYEYCDAGMSAADISRELGIGKGEVRLIMGLRKDRGY